MLMALNAKYKLGFVDGSILKSTAGDKLAGFWSRCDSMVTCWLLNSVSKEIADSLLYIDTAQAIWSDLYDRFHQSNAPRIFQIKKQIHDLNQGSLDINTYYTRLKILWDELKNFQPVPVCSCGGMKAWMDYQQQECVMQFMMGLNESYATTRGQILMLDPLPPISKVFNLIVQEERQRTIGSGSGTHSSAPVDTMAFNSSTPSTVAAATATPSKLKRDRPICSHCGINGHTVDSCYKLHGYPPGYKPKSKPNPSSSMSSIQSTPNFYKGSPTFHGGGPLSSPTAAFSTATSSPPNLTSTALSTDQVQQLIAYLSSQLHHRVTEPSGTSSILGQPPSSSPSVSQIHGNHLTHSTDSSHTWVIDTGDTHHVCCDVSHFIDSTPIHNTTVSLPNGQSVAIDRIGSVRLSNTLLLHNELFVPTFGFNLLSVSALIHSLRCCVNFLSDSCVIQDLTQGLTIGKGRRQSNLYFLELGTISCNSVSSNSVLSKSDIWHFRLGHPSTVNIKMLHNELQIPDSLSHFSSHCRICHLAKQKRLPFISNNNLSAKPFDLIHIDVWGPYHVSTTSIHRYFLTIVDDCTRATWVYLLCNKSNVLTLFPDFYNMIFNQYNTSITAVPVDNAPELTFLDFFRSKGILPFHSCIETPEQNYVVERKHQHILNFARALLFQSNVPLCY